VFSVYFLSFFCVVLYFVKFLYHGAYRYLISESRQRNSYST